jgi:hypothetical protein
MKNPQHVGVQYEPPSTRDYGTITTTQTKKQHQTNHSTNRNTIPPHLQHQEPSPSLSKHQDHFSTTSPPHQQQNTSLKNDPSPPTQKNYLLRPTRNDRKPPSTHIIPIKPDYSRGDDHTTWHEPEPITDDPHKPTKSIHKQLPDRKEQKVDMTSYDDIPIDSYINKLPSGGSVSIPPSTVIQPDTLPRAHTHHVSPPRRDYDEPRNKNKISDISFHHGQQQRIRPMTDSPLLNIGTENIVRQSPHQEFTTPIPDTHYTHEPNRDFTTNDNNHSSALRSRNQRTILLPVINSARTYVFETYPFSTNNVHQTRPNGNPLPGRSLSVRTLNLSPEGNDFRSRSIGTTN